MRTHTLSPRTTPKRDDRPTVELRSYCTPRTSNTSPVNWKPPQLQRSSHLSFGGAHEEVGTSLFNRTSQCNPSSLDHRTDMHNHRASIEAFPLFPASVMMHHVIGLRSHRAGIDPLPRL